MDLIGNETKSEKRKRAFAIRDAVKAALSTPLGIDRIKYYRDNGVELPDEQLTVGFEMVMGQVKSAAGKDNTNAFKTLIELADDIDKDGLFFELPVRVLARSFIDLYRSIHNQEFKEYVIKGGRYSTKSSFISLVTIELIKQNPEMHGLIVRPYENTLRDSVYSQLIWAITELSDNHNWRNTTSPMQITYKPTGQVIYMRGADDPGKIKSIKPQFGYIGLLWFEELDQFRGEEQIRNVQQSALRGGDATYVFKSFNPPRSRAAWANKYCKIPKENMYVHHSTYLDVPTNWIGTYALEEAEHLKEVNEAAYRHELLGEEIGDGGNVFDNLSLLEISDEDIARFSQMYFGQDWGWYPDPNIFVAMNYDANRRVLHIYDEVVGNKQENIVWADKIRDYIAYQITADSAEQKSINDFKTMGFAMRGAIKGPGSVEYSMKWLASLTKIIIDPIRCPFTAREFTQYELERDKNGDVITAYPDKDNHSIDSVRYALENIWRKAGQ